jgi:hypothetical protein
MASFKEFVQTNPNNPVKAAVWKATKPEIVGMLKNINPNMPLAYTPIPATHKGSTYMQDGIRITGTKQFITSVVSRLKDVLSYENQQTKLNIVYKQIDKVDENNPNRTSFAFYVQVKERGDTE